MATPVARSLLNKGRASLRFIHDSLLRPSNATSVKGQSLLAPSDVILGQDCADLNQQVTASILRLFGRASLLVGEDWRGLGRKYSVMATTEVVLEMRRSKAFSEEDEFDYMFGKFSDDDDDEGDFDEADLKDDDGDDDDDDDDEDNEDPDVPRKRRK